MDNELDFDVVQKFLLKQGKNGSKLLSVLGKQAKLVQAFESEIGKEILRDATSRAEFLLEKIINEDATDPEKAEYRALKRILLMWGERINLYYSNLAKITG